MGLPFTDSGFANLSFQYKTADATSRSVQRPDAAALDAAGVPDIAQSPKYGVHQRLMTTSLSLVMLV